MITVDIKQLATDFDMGDMDKRYVYKRVNGFIVSAFAEEKRRVLIINAYFTPEEYEEKKDEIDELINELNGPRRLIGYKYDERGEFEFSFLPSRDAYYYMSGLMNAFTGKLKELGALGADHCYICHEPLEHGNRHFVEYNSSAKAMHKECAQKLLKASKGLEPDRNINPPNRKNGRVGAICGAVLGAMMWSILYWMGIPYHLNALMGLVIGFAVKKLYDLRGGCEGWFKVFTVAIANLCAIVAGSMFGAVTKYLKLVAAGEAPKIGLIRMIGRAPMDLWENRITLLIGFGLSLAICIDVIVTKGKVKLEEEKYPLCRHIRSY